MRTPLDSNPSSRTSWGRTGVCWRRPWWVAPSPSHISPDDLRGSFSACCRPVCPSPQTPHAPGPDPKWRAAPSSFWEVRTGLFVASDWRQVNSSWNGQFWPEPLTPPGRPQMAFSSTRCVAARSCICGPSHGSWSRVGSVCRCPFDSG